MSAATGRDIVVMGASAGGVEALTKLVSQLPARLPAAVFIVLHVPSGMRSRLPEILDRRSALRVRHARDGDRIEPGRILVAPPDFHLELGEHTVRLVRGPRENSSRPSIDALFRSAAATHGPRSVAVILSGYLDDGAQGMRQIVDSGGVGIAQDPSEALNPEMPENAIERADLRLVLPVAEIARKVSELVVGDERAGRRRMPERPEAQVDQAQVGAGDAPGMPTGLSCPDCHGVLWTSPDAGSATLHCRVGHTFSIETLQQAQAVAVEKALWAAVRSLREQASVAAHIARRAEERQTPGLARRYRDRERQARANAETLERILARNLPEDSAGERPGEAETTA